MSKEERHYREITREWYKDIDKARGYDSTQTGRLTLRNGPYVVIARREIGLVGRALAGLSPGPKTILDVPCGTGKLDGLFSELGVRAVGMDISQEMLSVLKEKTEMEPRFGKLLCADATCLPFPEATFDTIVCLRLLHRVPHSIRLTMLKEFARVARRHVIVSVGINDGFQRLRLFLRNSLSQIGTVPFPVSLKEFQAELLAAGLIPLRSWNVLPVLSSGIVLLTGRTK